MGQAWKKKKSSTKLKRKKLSQKQRKARVKEMNKLLGQPVPQGNAAAALHLYGLITAFRRLGNVTDLNAAVYRKLRKRLIPKLAMAMEQLKFSPADFGADDLPTFARRLVDSLVEFRIHQYSSKGLRKVRGNLFGRLFHDFAWHERKLRQLFTMLAEKTVKELNREIGRPGTPGILNADGAVYGEGAMKGMPALPPLAGKFHPARRATKIYEMVLEDGAEKPVPREFMDGALVSFLNDSKYAAMCLVLTGEFKGIGASKKFGPQVGNAKNRFADLVSLKMWVEGLGEVDVPRERIVFLSDGAERLAIRPAAVNQSTEELHYKISTTRTGGFPEWYYRIFSTVKSQPIYDLIDAFTP
jgi:hypothetical protein